MFFICVRKRFFPFEECPPLYHLMIVSSLRTSAKKYDKEKWLSSRSLLIPVHTSNACWYFCFLMGAPRVWMLLPHQYCTPCFPALECIVWVGTLKLGINHTKHMMSLCKEAQSNFPGKIKGSQGKKCLSQNTLPNRWKLKTWVYFWLCLVRPCIHVDLHWLAVTLVEINFAHLKSWCKFFTNWPPNKVDEIWVKSIHCCYMGLSPDIKMFVFPTCVHWWENLWVTLANQCKSLCKFNLQLTTCKFMRVCLARALHSLEFCYCTFNLSYSRNQMQLWSHSAHIPTPVEHDCCKRPISLHVLYKQPVDFAALHGKVVIRKKNSWAVFMFLVNWPFPQSNTWL